MEKETQSFRHNKRFRQRPSSQPTVPGARNGADAASASPGLSLSAAVSVEPLNDRGLKSPQKFTSADGGEKRIFLVDDHPLVREWLGALIDQTADLRVCGDASCAHDALKGIARLCPDVAIVDLSLPDASGFQVIRSIRTQSPDTGIVVLSMHEERTYAERAIREGARAYVMKGENTGAIISAVRKVVEGGIFLSPSMKIANTGNFLHGALSGGRSPIDRLSAREREVFELLGQTHGTRQIAEALHISVKTVQSFCERIKEKLQLANASELLREAVRWVDSQEARNGHD